MSPTHMYGQTDNFSVLFVLLCIRLETLLTRVEKCQVDFYQNYTNDAIL